MSKTHHHEPQQNRKPKPLQLKRQRVKDLLQPHQPQERPQEDAPPWKPLG